MLLASVNYDPAVAVTKTTIATQAMTALDTAALRLTFTVPANGKVLVRQRGVLHGAATYPQVLFGVMDGATVVSRIAPNVVLSGTAVATTFAVAEAVYTISNLTPAANLTWDAALGVETLVASTALKYGGPNDATANNAFGAYVFEIWEA